jgi:hypothetical protein
LKGDTAIKLSIPRNVTWKVVKSGVVVLNIEKGTYYTLNETASRIWKLVAEGKSTQAIQKELGDAYEVPEAVLRKDLAETMTYLKQESLLLEDADSGAVPHPLEGRNHGREKSRKG